MNMDKIMEVEKKYSDLHEKIQKELKETNVFESKAKNLGMNNYLPQYQVERANINDTLKEVEKSIKSLDELAVKAGIKKFADDNIAFKKELHDLNDELARLRVLIA